MHHLFGAGLDDYTGRDGRIYHRPDRAPVVPRALARWVEDVAGLDADAGPALGRGPRPRSPRSSPTDSKTFYDVGPLHEREIDGRGQTIALLSIDRFDKANV